MCVSKLKHLYNLPRCGYYCEHVRLMVCLTGKHHKQLHLDIFTFFCDPESPTDNLPGSVTWVEQYELRGLVVLQVAVWYW
jgi:hypothetical protein